MVLCNGYNIGQIVKTSDTPLITKFKLIYNFCLIVYQITIIRSFLPILVFFKEIDINKIIKVNILC